MATRSSLVLDSVLALIKPLVRLMLRHGVAYPTFAAALKRVFLAAAREELQAREMAQTDSAVSLLSGVHRRDVRTLSRPDPDVPPAERPAAAGLAAQVAARWLSDAQYLDEEDHPLPLPRSGEALCFDALVAGVSRDVRPRAVLDELLRLGVVQEEADGRVRLSAEGFTPRHGFEELSWQMRDNLHDHLAAASMNLDENRNFLEQAVYVDRITEASAQRLHRVASQAWRQAFKTVMREAQIRFDHDAQNAAEAERTQRARFGVYFFHEHQPDSPPEPGPGENPERP